LLWSCACLTNGSLSCVLWAQGCAVMCLGQLLQWDAHRRLAALSKRPKQSPQSPVYCIPTGQG
jgi:hypothetical protein